MFESIAPIDWQSVATILTGALAVGAATLVGKRQLDITEQQVAIASQQNQILKRQTGLQELTLRHDLFEKRYTVYRKAYDFLFEIRRTAAPPNIEIQGEYISALQESRFLFAPAVFSSLLEIWENYIAFALVYHDGQKSYAETGSYGQDHADRFLKLQLSLDRALTNLLDTFGPEMKLTFDEFMK